MYWGDLDDDTSDLSEAEFGAYIRLIQAYWINGGPISDNKQRIYSRVRAHSTTGKRLYNDILKSFFVHKNGAYHHKRIDKELAQASKNIRKNKQRTAAATAARKLKRSNVTSNVTLTPSPTPTPISKKKKTPLTPLKNACQNVDNSHNPLLNKGKNTDNYVDNSSNPLKTFTIHNYIDDSVRKQAERDNPKWSIFELARVYDEGVHNGKRSIPHTPAKAFLAWCNCYTRNKRPS